MSSIAARMRRELRSRMRSGVLLEVDCYSFIFHLASWRVDPVCITASNKLKVMVLGWP
jgi:hypothetical protein